ncbi:HNH endonuclease [Lachnospiraceae bacterium NSJ-12]|uniref:HNH endonuclease n=2 Tax=Zhenhengia yiwuensis TaxID=2763666 RepID=A0A926EIQ2_9FIRM|nr:HNH endonuclease [Zhenhengia yiwuensis]
MNFIKKYCSCGKIIRLNEICSCKNYTRKIDKDKSRFYSSYAWKKLRNMRVKEQPYCERCWSLHKLIVTDCLQGHHILSYKHYNHLKLDYLNVAVLCRTCNVQLGDSNVLDWKVSEEVREYVEVNR